jgi:hypothetical protein
MEATVAKAVVAALIGFVVTVDEESSSDLASSDFCSLGELDAFSKLFQIKD